MSSKTRKNISQMVTYIILSVLSVAAVLPIFITVANSFMSTSEVARRFSVYVIPENLLNAINGIHFVEISFIPDFFSLSQYSKLLFSTTFYLGLYWNSIKLLLPILILQLILAVPAAYGIEFSRKKYKEVIFFVYVLIMLTPLQVSIVPNYLTAKFFNLSEYAAIIIPGIAAPFGVFLIRQSLKGIPYEIIEAAKIDGCGHFGIMMHMIIPLVKSSIATLTILNFVEYWNIVEQAVVFVKETYNEPMSVYLSRMVGGNSGMIFAASCLYMLPAIIIFLYGQEYIIDGVRIAGIK